MLKDDKQSAALLNATSGRPPVCSDFDVDCDDVVSKLNCWMYDPAKGRCPYLGKQEPRP